MKSELKKCLAFLVQNNVPNSENLVRDITCKLNLYNDSEILGYVSKADLEGLGFDCRNIDEGDLQSIAEDVMGSFTDCLYWESLRTIAEDMNIPEKKENKGKATVYTKDTKGDVLICNNCSDESGNNIMILDEFADVCPRCGKEGYLKWANAEHGGEAQEISDLAFEYDLVYHE